MQEDPQYSVTGLQSNMSNELKRKTKLDTVVGTDSELTTRKKVKVSVSLLSTCMNECGLNVGFLWLAITFLCLWGSFLFVGPDYFLYLLLPTKCHSAFELTLSPALVNTKNSRSHPEVQR